MKNFSVILALTFPVFVFAQNLNEMLAVMVPNGTVLNQSTMFKIKSPKNTEIEIIFTKEGAFNYAIGESPENDIFFLGKSGISLTETVAILKKVGKNPQGEWGLAFHPVAGWCYQFDATENGKETKYNVAAKTGKILGPSDCDN